MRNAERTVSSPARASRLRRPGSVISDSSLSIHSCVEPAKNPLAPSSIKSTHCPTAEQRRPAHNLCLNQESRLLHSNSEPRGQA